MVLGLDTGEEIIALKFGACAVIVCIRQANGKTRRVKAEAEEILSQLKGNNQGGRKKWAN